MHFVSIIAMPIGIVDGRSCIEKTEGCIVFCWLFRLSFMVAVINSLGGRHIYASNTFTVGLIVTHS